MRRGIAIHPAAWLVLAVLAAGAAQADAIVVTKAMTASTIAEIDIEQESIRVEVEVGERDLSAFRNLMPDEVYEGMGFAAEPLERRLERFFREDFVFLPDGGEPLPGRVVGVEPRRRVLRDELTGEPLPSGEDEGEPVLFLVLEYALRQPPGSLTILAPGTNGATASIGFVAYHQGLPINDFRYLSRQQTVDLDWDDPWYSHFDSVNLRRQYDAPLNVFLYVEPFEVRVEVIARPLDVQNWVDLGLAGAERIPVEAQAEVKQSVAEYLATQFDLTVDGAPVVPELDRVHFLNRTLKTSTVIDPPVELDAVSATLGVIWVAPTSGLPEEAEIVWSRFSERIRRVPAAATDEAGPLRFYLTPDDNVLWWKNVLQNPTLPTLVAVAPPPGRLARAAPALAAVLGLVGLVLLGARWVGSGGRSPGRFVAALVLLAVATGLFVWRPSRVDDAATEEVVAALLHNVYRAFDYREESAIYDVLDRSVSGDLLTRIYLETRRGLELQSQGGARAKVKAIEIERVEPRATSSGPGFVARCRWYVSGSVGHWGHVHTRINGYEADLTIRPVDGDWKIIDLSLLEEKRVG